MSETVSWDEVKAQDYEGMDAAERAAFDAGVQAKRLAIEVGEMIHQARIDAGLTQAELAERAGTTQPAVSAIERAVQPPTMALLTRLALALGTTLVIKAGQEPAAEDPFRVRGGRPSRSA